MKDNFEKLNITDDVLDKLGFSEYHDINGTSGRRILRFKDGTFFQIVEVDQMDDVSEGYGEPKYVAGYFYYASGSKFYDLFFLHELFEAIRENFSVEHIFEFVEKCKGVHMGSYIISYYDNIREAWGIRVEMGFREESSNIPSDRDPSVKLGIDGFSFSSELLKLPTDISPDTILFGYLKGLRTQISLYYAQDSKIVLVTNDSNSYLLQKDLDRLHFTDKKVNPFK